MLPRFKLDEQGDGPLYRQLFEQVRSAILSGELADGARLFPTRELAEQLGLNRTTVSAAYDLLAAEGLISGQVGRGSFVTYKGASGRPIAADDVISFAASRPSELLFPIEDFRKTCDEVIHGADAVSILQLGAPSGYGPLRRYLLEQARREGLAGPDDDIAITSGCQQAVDLIQRTLVAPGDVVVTEDPVYPGLRHAFARSGARIVGVAVGEGDIEPAASPKNP